MSSCNDDIPDYNNDIQGNFEAIWNLIDTRYCYLDEKNINWDSIGNAYRKELYSYKEIAVEDYFNICARMLCELKDGHVNLIAPFNTSAYRNWWSDYPQDFNLRTLQQFYLQFDYSQVGSLLYKELPDSIGYIYYSSFSSKVSESLIDNVLLKFNHCKALIIDVRNNGGGELTNIRPFVSRFIKKDLTAGYIRHKTGPGHSEFSEPYPIIYHPALTGHMSWSKSVIVLCNRSTFSAANEFVSVMKQLPQVTVMGAKTGGGGGLPFSGELPIGWVLRFSASPISDAQGNNIEFGIDPDPGFEAHSPADSLAIGKDIILDKALQFLNAH